MPLETFPKTNIGHIHFDQDIDGIVRKTFHRIYYQKTLLHSFSSAIIDVIHPGGSSTAEIESKVKERHGDRVDRIYQMDPMLINYYGPGGTYPSVSFLDVIEDKWPPSFLKDKIVLVGLTCAGLEESLVTPFTQDRNRMHGIEVHAHILNNLLDRSQTRKVHGWTGWTLATGLSLLAFFLLARLGGLRATLVWILCLIAVMILVLVLFSAFNLWVPPASLYFSITLAFILAYIFKLEKMGTLLRRAKEDWEESFNTINDAITIHEADGRIVRTNRAARNIFGEPLLELLEERSIRLLKGGPQPPEQGMKDQNPGFDAPTIEEMYDSKIEKHLEIKTLPRLDDNGHFFGMVHIVRDITEKVETEERQRQLQIQLVQAQKMEAIGTLAAGIAHDFNNILSAIMGYTELAAFELPHENKAQRQLKEVLKGGQRAKELVNQILTFSRQSEHKKQTVEMGPVIKEALKLLRSTLPSTIEIRTDIDTTGTILGDPTRVHQIVVNLCANAFHAMHQEGGILHVMLRDIANVSEPLIPDLSPGHYVGLSISDTGPGISSEIVNRIFDPYFTTKKQGEGTGLGLAVVHGIVKSQGGTITVRSKPGKGTRFDVFLPRIDESIDAEQKKPEPIPGGKERILLVDDEEVLAAMGQEMLERLGYEVIARTSSIEALETFRADPQNIDLVITDMTMPLMTGDMLAKELMKTRSDIPIILCTGFSETMTEEKAMAIGIREYLMKPLIMSELAKTIRRILDKD